MAKKNENVPVTQTDLSSLAALAAQTAEEERSTWEVERRYSYIKFAQNSASIGDDLVLRKGFPATVLAIVKVYEDTIPPESGGGLRQIRGYWMPKDAEQIDLAEGKFDLRVYYDNKGVEHWLKVCHWMFLYLHDHPEIDDAVYTFRSTGNKYCKTIQRLLSTNASTSTELQLSFDSEVVKFPEYKSTAYYPKASILKRNYELKDGKIALLKDGLKLPELEHILKLSAQINNEYKNFRMVREGGKLNEVASIEAPAEKPKIEHKPTAKKAGSPARF